MRALKVKDIKKLLENLPDNAYVMSGDSDKMGRNDISITHMVAKQCGFDESDEQYYVLCGRLSSQGCLKI